MQDICSITHRQIWIDWMKVLGMFFIVLGHLKPTFMYFTYSFSVQLFFFISGYLEKEQTVQLALKKCIRSLIIPYILLCLICLIIDYFLSEKISFLTAAVRIKNDLLGIFWNGCGVLWFVYSLTLLKVMNGILSSRMMIWCSLLSLIMIYYLNKTGVMPRGNSWANLMIALPFFVLGKLSACFKLSRCVVNLLSVKQIFAMGGVIVFLLFLSCKNGVVYMYEGRYGNDIFLFLLNSVMGVYIVYVISKLLESLTNKFNKSIVWISRGNIIILAFHPFILRYLIIDTPCFILNDTTKVLIAFAIVILFLPVIIVINKFMPILMGNRK